MVHLIGSFLPLLLLIAFVMVVISAFTANIGSEPKVQRKPIMSPAEIKFWHLLRSVTGHHVAPQVSMGALLKSASGLDPKGRARSRNKYSQKMVDFVLVDESGDVRLLIELDDRTHERASTVKSDAERDRMTALARYRTLRVTGKARSDAGLLRTQVEAALTD